MNSREEIIQKTDSSFVLKTIEAVNRGETRSFDSFMNDLKKKYLIHK